MSILHHPQPHDISPGPSAPLTPADVDHQLAKLRFVNPSGAVPPCLIATAKVNNQHDGAIVFDVHSADGGGWWLGNIAIEFNDRNHPLSVRATGTVDLADITNLLIALNVRGEEQDGDAIWTYHDLAKTPIEFYGG